MKLKVAVTDANIFIDLYDLGLIKSFFNLDLEIHTTSAVLFELYSEQQEVLKAYQSVGKLEVHNLQEKDFIEIYNENYPNLYPKQINLFYMLPIKLMLVC